LNLAEASKRDALAVAMPSRSRCSTSKKSQRMRCFPDAPAVAAWVARRAQASQRGLCGRVDVDVGCRCGVAMAELLCLDSLVRMQERPTREQSPSDCQISDLVQLSLTPGSYPFDDSFAFWQYL